MGMRARRINKCGTPYVEIDWGDSFDSIGLTRPSLMGRVEAAHLGAKMEEAAKLIDAATALDAEPDVWLEVGRRCG